ncbi:MAG: class I SAM-dependent methyltransferase [Streptosporangiaceae bacterium]
MTPWREGPISAAALEQQRLWGSDPAGWARFAEPHTRPLFEAVLAATGTRLLDVGCGSGLLLEMAQARGATATGLDVAPGLLTAARDRVPGADLWLADLQRLPFPNGSFDAVTGVNAFQFAGDPREALREAARVCRPGGVVAASTFAEPGRVESTVVSEAMSALSPPQRQAAHAPYSLSAPGGLEAGVADAGLRAGASGEVECVWRYDSLADACRGLLSSAGGTRAAQDAGRGAVEAGIAKAVVPFTDPGTGVISMRNVFRWVSAVRP